MSMRTLFLALALLSGCSCRTTTTSDVGTSDSGSGVDANGADAFVSIDAALDSAPYPDAHITAPICGSIVATRCPTQRAEDVSACMDGAGAVFFDGAHCQQTASLSCGAERGAFRSFEECAVVCEAAGECDEAKLAYTNPDGGATCRTPSGIAPVCGGGAAMLVDEARLIDCESFRFFESCYSSLPHRCGHDSNPIHNWEEVWVPFRRASLLPFVYGLECSLGGP